LINLSPPITSFFCILPHTRVRSITYPWLDHIVSGRNHNSLALINKLDFSMPTPNGLNSLLWLTYGSIIQKVRLKVAVLFAKYFKSFHSLQGLFFIFPSRYSVRYRLLTLFKIRSWYPFSNKYTYIILLKTILLCTKRTHTYLPLPLRLLVASLYWTYFNFAHHYFWNLFWFFFLQVLRCLNSLR
jgi:hypothetical protein